MDFTKTCRFEFACATLGLLVGVFCPWSAHASADGFGGFESPVLYTTGDRPRALAIGDLTGDGVPDLAVANYGDSTLTVLRGNSDGTFETVGNVATRIVPDVVALGDFNGDQLLDAAVQGDGNDSRTAVHLNLGAGQLDAAAYFDTGGRSRSVAVADINDDGAADLVLGMLDPPGISVMSGNGDGTFVAPVHTPLALAVWNLTIVDFDGDGSVDVGAACIDLVPPADGDEIQVLLNDGNGGFQSPIRQSVLATPTDVTFGDFNGDGTLDAAAANHSGFATVLLGSGGNGFASQEEIFLNGKPTSIIAIDVNNDGHEDLIAVDQYLNRANVLLGNGSGNFGEPLTYATGLNPVDVVSADFDRDGHEDIAVTNFTSTFDSIAVLFNGTGASVCAELIDVSSTTGEIFFGGVEELRESDDLFVLVRSGFGNSFFDLHNSEIQVSAMTSVEDPSSAVVTIESFISEPVGHGEIRVLNHTTGEFDLVHFQLLDQTQQTVSTAPLDASHYIGQNGEIEVRIKHLVFVPFLAFQFDSIFDLVEIAVE